jgi:hypothetical protein
MAKYVKPTHNELVFAYRFLTYLHANTNNSYLILAVVAWLRQESGSRWLGNNPLNIRNSQYASGYRQTKANGHFAIFRTLDAAARASAQFLLRNKGNGYELVVAAARRNGNPAKDYGKQGADFLMALAMSKWDAGHYGTAIYGFDGKRGDEHLVILGYDQSKNHLIAVWEHLLGHNFTLPADVLPLQKAPPEPKPPPPPHQKQGGLHAVPGHEYILPYASATFYEARHEAPLSNPGDPASTGL